MQVFSEVGYGNGTIFVSPGAHDRDHEHEEWFSRGEDDSGKEILRPIQFKVKFTDGAAEVPDALGEYLCAEGLAKRSLVRAAVATVSETFDALAKIVYQKPIAVGRPLSESTRRRAEELRHNAPAG